MIKRQPRGSWELVIPVEEHHDASADDVEPRLVLLESPGKASPPLAAPNKKLHYCFQHKLELLLVDSLNKL